MASAPSFTEYWHEQPEGEVHSVLWPYVEFLETQNAQRLRELLRNHGLYGNSDVVGFQPYGYFRNSQSPYSNASNPTLNICESMVDTAANRIAGSSQIAVEFVTTDGDWSQQRKAKQRSRFVDGLFYKNDAPELGEEMVTDAGIYGEGYTKIFERNAEVSFERVFPAEMMVDPLEAMYGQPRQIFQKKAIPRNQVMKRWGKKKGLKKLIEDAPSIKPVGRYQQSAAAPDMIAVVEAYYLPTSKDSGDGVRAVILQNVTLEKAEWTHEYFPYAIFRWKRKRLGFYGQSIVSSVARIQGEINQYMRVASRSHYALAVPRIWVQPGSGFNPDHFTRDLGSVIESASEPRILAQQILPNEFYEHLKWLIMQAYKVIGISEMGAAAQKSPGVTAAVAINAEVDLQSDRLANPSKRYESYFVELARKGVDCVKDIYSRTGEYKVRVKKRRGVLEMDWADSDDLDDDATLMQANPMSALPKQIPGKLEYINTLLQTGQVTRAQAARLYSDPDIDAMLDPQSAKEEVIRQKIEAILDHGFEGFDPPEPFDDLDLSMKLFIDAYNDAKLHNAPDDVLDALRQYIFQVKALMPAPAPLPQLPGLPGSKGPESAPPPNSMPAAPPGAAPPTMQ